MRFLIILLVFFFIFVCEINSQNLVGNVISVSTNQPCLDIDASLINTTSNQFKCSTATILQLGLSPLSTNETSSTSFVFKALPQSTGTYQQNFDSSINEAISLCDQPGSSACIASIENELLFRLTFELQPIPVRYALKSIGLTVPSGYYFQTRPYGINSEAPLEACGIDPYSDVTMQDEEKQWNYAKGTNSVVIDKFKIDNSTFPSGVISTDIFAKYLLSAFALQVPGAEFATTADCSNDNAPDTCTFNLTSVIFGEITNQFDAYSANSKEVVDSVFNRWLNGTLGCGQAFAATDLYTGSDISTINFQKSYEQCTNPIGNSGSPTGKWNSWTTNVCPGNLLPNFRARNNNIYPSYCINGPCAGLEEPFCALIEGFQFGFSRCLMSKNAAIEYLLSVGSNRCDAVYQTPFFGTDCTSDDTAPRSVWFDCLKEAYLANVPDFDPTLLSVFDQAVNSEICGAYLQLITGPDPPLSNCDVNDCSDEYDATPTCPYPNIEHQAAHCDSGDNHVCINPGSTGKWTNAPFVNQLRQLIIPFQSYTGDGNYQVGFCGTSDITPGQTFSGISREISPTISTSPCSCSAANGWQDTVIPIGPLCTVYALENPGEPAYELTVTMESNDGSVCSIKIGTAVGDEGETILSGACNNTVLASILNVDRPRGNVLPTLNGYIVVCGDIPNDEVDGVTVEDFYGGPDKSGRTNPYTAYLNEDTIPYRTPLPSTMKDMFGDECTKDSLGRCAWWYYVPYEELEQYGVNCNQNGFVNYGVFEPIPTTIMCENKPGTCVPGYDVRTYNAKRFDSNATTNLDGYPEKWPTTKQPLYVARTFVDAELQKTGGNPINLPLAWNQYQPNCWLNAGYLFCDSSNTGAPAFPDGSLFIRTEITVAGELLTESTSFAPGELCYNPTSLPANGVINSCNQDYNSQVGASSCTVFINGGGGSLKTIVHNTGIQTGTYTIIGNCTNGATIVSDFDFSVDTNQYATVDIAMDFVNINGENPVCDVYLQIAFINVTVSSLKYLCMMQKSVYDAPGTTVIGTENPNLGSIYDPPYHQATSGHACDGQDPAWWCLSFNFIGNIMSWLYTILFAILFIVIIATTATMISRYVKENTERIRATRARSEGEIDKLIVETNQQIAAMNEEKKVTKSIKAQEEERNRILNQNSNNNREEIDFSESK